MKKLRMILAFALVLSMVLALGACGSSTSNESAASSSPAATESAAVSESAAAPESAAATESATDSANTLVWATNAEFPPYEYYDGDQVVGIDADIAALIAEKMGMTAKVSDMNFDSIIAAVQSGKADIGMAGMTVTDERKLAVDFSTSYATGKQVIIVKDGSDITKPDDLTGKMIGVQQSTTGDIYITSDYVDKGTAQITRYNKGADAIMALTQDKVDAVVIDSEPAKVFVKQNKGLKILETEYVTEDYAIAIKKGNTELLDKINTALDELTKSGQIQAVIDKYIKAD